MANVYSKIQKYTQRHKQRKAWHKVLWALSCITVFCITYALILPGFSQENTVYCGMEEHSHSIEGGCYQEELICGMEESEEHQHSADCYTYELICSLEEHSHTLACHSNPDADVETTEDWEASFADVELTDDLSANLIAIARSQLDYAESTENYTVLEDGMTTRGYTRYGAWYGDWYSKNNQDSEKVDFIYEDWDAMFASFCLYYAGITEKEIPYEESCARWVEQLTELGQFYTPEDLKEENPCVGDLVFFDGDQDGTADHVGIVTGYTYVDDNQDNEVNGITTIEGNSGDKVAEQEYALDCGEICGYGYFVADEGTTITWTEDEQAWIDKATGAVNEETKNTASGLIAVAESQVSYKETTGWSEALGNYTYSMYGKKYGNEYLGEWSAAFASFCLDYAGTDASFPRGINVTDWVTALESAKSYKAVTVGYLPQKGDLIFYTPWWPNDVTRVAIVAESATATDTDFPVIVINNGTVEKTTAKVWDANGNVAVGTITGYGITPFTDKAAPEPEPEPEPEPDIPTEWTLLGTDESITANLYQCTYDSTVTDRNMTHYIPGESAELKLSGADSTVYKRTSSKTINSIAYQYHEYLIPLETVLNKYSGSDVNTGVDLSTVSEDDVSPFMSGRSKNTFTTTVMKGNDSPTPDYMWKQHYPDEIANALTAGSYVLKDGTWYLQVRATEAYGNDVLDIYYAALDLETGAVSPSSSSINIFDYWIDSRDARDIFSYADAGINSGHAVKFFWSNNDTSIKSGNNTGVINTSTQEYDNGVVQGIVRNKLVNGYPVLSGNLQNDGNSTEPLSYLFDPKDTSCSYRAAYTNVKGLLQATNDGYYYFDAGKNAAEYDESANRFNLYTTPVMAAGGDSPFGQFFPFEDAHQAALESSVCDDVQHYFGMTLTAKFIQQNRGTNEGKPVTFKFTGDDDVWIFIDDVLVADLGGVHSKCSVTINFATGKVVITGVQGVSTDGKSIENSYTVSEKTLRQQFTTALGEDKIEASDWSGSTFADDTTHTLKFFYMERGNWDSSLSLEYNLVDVPPTSIYKVDQYGKTLVDATFATYAAEKVTDDNGNVTSYKYKLDGGGSSTWQDSWYLNTETGDIYDGKDGSRIITATYHGTTDRNGEMQFLDEYGGPFTEKELKKTLTGDENGGCFILREISIPDGYRTVSDETWLSFSGSNMICDNTYKSGVWASPNALVTATNELHVADAYKEKAQTMKYTDGSTVLNNEKNIDYYNVNDGSKGTLFAVVLKRDGKSLDSIDTWDPLYGNDVDGYTVIEGSGETYADGENTYSSQLAAAIAAAQAQQKNLNDHSVVFTASASGMQALLEDLPGKITRYYTYMQEQGLLNKEDENDPQYFVAYYWTSESKLDDANTQNTVRVVSRSDIETGYDGFDIQWGTTLEVPNMENRLFFQKLNEDGALVDGAVFALYEAYDALISGSETERYVYYVGTDSETNDPSGQKVYVALTSSNGNNTGEAYVFKAITNEDGSDGAERIGKGSYEINTEGVSVDLTTGAVSGDKLGVIKVTVGDKPYYVYPVTNAKDETLVGATHDTCEYVTEAGTGHFIQLKNGKYYLREIYAPDGYELNTTDIPVLVNNNGVYANAGTKEDNVSVGNGTGYLTQTLDVFASPGEIDETLTWVYAALLRNDTSGFAAFDEVSGDVIDLNQTSTWHFVTKGTETRAGYGDQVSTAARDAALAEAMKTYLVYDGKLAAEKKAELIFDYVLNTKRTDESGAMLGEGRLRLYTDVGWSDLAIYQDNIYGKENTVSNTYYEDLSLLGNISNLFSSSTFVQVTDQSEGMVDLAIQKTDSSGKALEGASFRLIRETEKDDGYYVYDEATQTTTWVKNASDVTPVETNESGVCNFHGLKAGTYYLEEISAPAGYMARTETIKVVVTSVTKSTGMELVMAESSEATGIEPKDTVTEGDDAGKWLGILVDKNDKEVTTENPLTGDDTGHYLYTLIIPNNRDYRLPETGGMGTGLFYLTGVLLLLGAGVLLVNRKRSCR